MSSIMVVVIFIIIIIPVYVVSAIMVLIKLVLSDCNLVYFASIEPDSLTRRAIIDIRIIPSNFLHWCQTVNAVDGSRRHLWTCNLQNSKSPPKSPPPLSKPEEPSVLISVAPVSLVPLLSSLAAD